jgi:hypothetical protein
MQQDEYGFTIVNFNRILPFLEDFFAFFVHVEPISFFDDPCEVGWKMVLKNEP